MFASTGLSLEPFPLRMAARSCLNYQAWIIVNSYFNSIIEYERLSGDKSKSFLYSLLFGFGLMSYITFNSNLKAECAAAPTDAAAQAHFTRNELEKRAFVLQYPANDPCEDRFNCY
jgi:hypothetical protein